MSVHHSIFWVESRLGQSVAYSTVYTAPCAMAEQKLIDLKEIFDPSSGEAVWTVGNNVQAWIKLHNHHIG
jgi:hypothetical protein